MGDGGLENMGADSGGIGTSGPGLIPTAGAGLSAGWMEQAQKIGDAAIALLEDRINKLLGVAAAVTNKTFDVVASGVNNVASGVSSAAQAPMAMFQGRQGNEIESPSRGKGRNVADDTPVVSNQRPPQLPAQDLAQFQSVVMNAHAHDVSMADLGTGTHHGLSATNPEVNRAVSRDEGVGRAMSRSLNT